MKIERQQLRFERGHRLPGRDVVHAEVLQPDAPHIHLVTQRRNGVAAVVPHARQRMRSPDAAPVSVVNEHHPVSDSLLNDFFKFGHLIGGRREFGVSELDRKLVVLADADGVGVR